MAVDGFQFFYGDYVHEKGEVYPQAIQVIPRINDDGVRWASLYRMQIAGDFCTSDGTPMTVSDISTRIQELDDAYLYDYKDCGFLDPDGNLTPHKLTTNDYYNLSGNRIVRRSWDNTMPVEYASTRSFSVTIEALFQENYTEILAFREATTRRGTGGPMWKMYNLWNGTPYKEIVHNYSRVTHIQTGSIVSMSTWVDPVIYAPPYWPDEEMGWLRTITQHSPRHHGHPSFNRPTHYRVDYTYYFLRTTPGTFRSYIWV